jgi:Leucine-rich repeat (LRR) protein/Tol biopolymer transport system component
MPLRLLQRTASAVLTLLIAASAHAAIPQSEHDALVAFYASTGGSGWTNNSGWNGAAGTECSWFGVSCDSASTHVTQISLTSNNLAGTIPSLAAFGSLMSFDVRDNRLTGSLPALTGLSALSIFEVASNQLGGTLPALSGLTNLSQFDASYNRLTGTLPALAGLPNLSVFSVGFNQLSGSLPPLAGAPRLTYFEASYNGFTGNLPSLTGLSNLYYFGVAYNELTGPIPSLDALSSLVSFSAYNNLLTGNIPALGGLPSLTVFTVDSNRLTGTIPPLAGLTKLSFFGASYNQLSGTIPSLAGLTGLRAFNAGGNQLTGTLPSFAGLNLSSFDAFSNQLTGPIPPSLSDQKNLQDFEVDSNQLTGPIPPLDGLKNLSVFVAKNNRLTGNLPALQDLTNLLEFNVDANQLSGPIPSFAGLSGFYEFHANSNQLTGTIPSFAGLTSLEIFDVAGNQLTGSLPALGDTDLYTFRVNNNRLTGTIPSLVGQRHLRIFQVGDNLLSGAIPAVPSPNDLTRGLSNLCPNALTFSPDTNWDVATGLTPWYSTCASAQSNTVKPSTNIALSGDGAVKVFQSQQTDLTSNAGNSGGQDIYSVGADGRPVLESVDASGNKLIGTASLPAISPDGKVVAFLFVAASAPQAKDAFTGQMFAGARGQPKHPVDVGMGGIPANGGAVGAPSLSSSDGNNKLVFCSAASNLVQGDANNARDVFLVDPLNAAVAAQRVSVNSDGSELPGDSCEPRLSGDGRKVVFSLSSSPLFGTAARQIVMKFLSGSGKELITGQLLPITASGSGGAAADSAEPAVNQDGGVVAFTSQADLDGSGPPIGGREVFVSLARGNAARLTRRVRSGDGTVPNGASEHPRLSDDGTAVVMQTAATNFLQPGAQGKADTTNARQCGSVAITTNFFSVTALGDSLCGADGATLNANPTISGDGLIVGFDSNTLQPPGSVGRNAYAQGVGVYPVTGIPNLSGDYSGQWYDPRQSGQGLVIDVTNPDANNARTMVLTWFVFSNGQPVWLQGVGVPHAGTGQAANTVVVQMDQVGIFQGVSFPLGEARASGTVWGSITLTFTDANTGDMRWNTNHAGFTSGSMPIKHFLPVALPANDTANSPVKACYSGNWYEPAHSGHGFEFEVIPTPNGPLLSVDWFTYGPGGAPVWLFNTAPLSGNTSQMPLGFIDGTGAQFPPGFDAASIKIHIWGTASFTFTDASHAHVSWKPNLAEPGAAAYGAVELDVQPLSVGLLDRRSCQ